MGAEKRLLSVKEAFQLAQQPHQNQAKLVVALSRTYRTVSAPDRPEAPPDSARCQPHLLKPRFLRGSPPTPLSPAASGADRYPW